MRTLSFIVDDQIISADPLCDFNNLVPGTEGYLQARFSFSQQWSDCAKVAAFYVGTKECPPQLLKDGKTCMIPAEALEKREFSVQVVGKNASGLKIKTNRVTVQQTGGMN